MAKQLNDGGVDLSILPPWASSLPLEKQQEIATRARAEAFKETQARLEAEALKVAKLAAKQEIDPNAVLYDCVIDLPPFRNVHTLVVDNKSYESGKTYSLPLPLVSTLKYLENRQWVMYMRSEGKAPNGAPVARKYLRNLTRFGQG